jgi:hypothetical protein
MDLFNRIKQRPWNSRFFEIPKWSNNYPTMLTHEEMRMLAWLAMHVKVDGAVVDLGCFLGGSSVSLAWGVSKGSYERAVYSFDHFNIDEHGKYLYLYKRGHGFFPGTDAFPIFEKFTKPISDKIIPIKGDVLDYNWDKENISILFIDLAKTKQLNDHILYNFFPQLLPGSIIVQQDFLFFRTPWIYPTMHKLSDSIEFLSHTKDNSVVFGVHRSIKQEELTKCLSRNTTYDDTIDAIKYFRALFSTVRQLEMIDALAESFKAAPNADKAWLIPNATNIKLTVNE